MTRTQYDLLVIGGGIQGACVAWDAALRGLSVALLDKRDFGAATSANSLKIIHGGLRYLQHADFKRMRESIHERSTLMRIAPHLVHPLPILIPTYGHGLQGREVMALALMLNDLVSFDRNLLADPQKHLPRGRVISRRECLERLPDINPRNLTGGAVFYDAQVYNSERLVLAFLQSAAHAGAALANYVEVDGFQRSGNRITGVTARDRLTGEPFTLQARTVVNTAGPWVRRVCGLLRPHPDQTGPYLARAMNLITRSLFSTYAVGIASRNAYRDSDAVLDKGSRLLFAVPWRGHTMIGTDYVPYEGDPDAFHVAEPDVQNFIDEINRAYPAARLRRDDITFVHGGLVPISGVDAQTGSVRLIKHFQIDDHHDDGIEGLLSVTSVKYTTARYVAARVVDRVVAMQGRTAPRAATAHTPLYGGAIDRFETFLQAACDARPAGLGETEMRSLVYTYGAAYPEVLRAMEPTDSAETPETRRLALLRAQVRQAVQEEMAHKLADVVLRRTELGTVGHPGHATLRFCADEMGAALGWSAARIQQELHEVDTEGPWIGRSEELHGAELADPAVQQVGAETTQV